MDGTAAVSAESPESRSDNGKPQPIGRIIANKALRPPLKAPAPKPVPPPPRPQSARSLGYSFVPYPEELAALERAGTLPPSQLRVLTLRRFANPMTGEWFTTTQEVAVLIGTDRSTAQKALRLLERAQYLHIRHLRSHTVELVVYFGGFAEPEHVKEGLAPLRWDSNSTVAGTVNAHGSPQSGPPSHSSGSRTIGSTVPRVDSNPHDLGTPPKNMRQEEIRDGNKGSFSTAGYPQNARWRRVQDFIPDMHDEAVVQELARKMGEEYINNFLDLRRLFGLRRLEHACALALDRMLNRANPLRARPGAYVRWLLTNGKC